MWLLGKYSNNIAVINESGEEFTYENLWISSKNLAAQISNRCLVFCLCRNCVGSILGYVTFINNRIVPLLLDSQIDQQLLINLTEAYKPDYFWIHSSMTSNFDNYETVYSDYDYTLMKTHYHCEYPLFKELALLLTTSGTTGSCKLVRHSYTNIKSNMAAIAQYLELEKTERSITTLPMSYTYGLSVINSHLYAGASFIMTEKTLVQKEFWQQFKAYGTTSFSGVPYSYEILNRIQFVKMKLPTLRTMTQAGGRLSPDLHKKFAEYARDAGIRFYVMYGQTEATARMSYLPYQRSVEKYGSIGIAIPDGKLSLIDANEIEVTEPEVTGELVYEGANVMLGYAQDGQDLVKGDEYHGRLITGDMAKMDSDGFYYIVGRKKRFLKIFGNRVNLDEIELLLETKFSSLDLACSGVDDKIYIFITDDTLIENVRQYIINKTRLNRVAFVVKHLNEIPKNKAGKKSYGDLKQYFQ